MEPGFELRASGSTAPQHTDGWEELVSLGKGWELVGVDGRRAETEASKD